MVNAQGNGIELRGGLYSAFAHIQDARTLIRNLRRLLELIELNEGMNNLPAGDITKDLQIKFLKLMLRELKSAIKYGLTRRSRSSRSGSEIGRIARALRLSKSRAQPA